MAELQDFGTIVLVVSIGFSLALAANKLTDWFPIPSPALFLVAAAVVSDLFPAISERLPVKTVERIGVVALIVILLEGGMHVGWRRFRGSAFPIGSLGVVGTFGTAAVVAAAAHFALGFDWTTAFILGAALAPTDPAVMFSVLGKREVGGRSGTILEGESGANDPVGIALMIGVLEFATTEGASVWTIASDFSVEMGVGLAVGLAGGAALLPMMRVPLPHAGLYPLRVLAAAGVIFGAASVLNGSGFLAVFITGLLIGDARAPYKGQVEDFHAALASLAEITVFVALGLTIDVTEIFAGGVWLDGLVLAVILALVARPVVAAVLLAPVRLRFGERLFVIWGGLKGAVPILLAAFALLANVDDARRIYEIVFVVVLFSVVVQGTTLPYAAARLGIPMRTHVPEPWDFSVRLREAPDVRRFVVGRGARAAGHAIRDLPLGERAWITLVIKDGAARRPGGSYVIQPGDELVVLAGGGESEEALERLFEHPREEAVR